MKKKTCILLIIFILLSSSLSADTNVFKLGVENISDSFISYLRNKSIGLITNQTGIDQAGQRNVDILIAKGLTIAYLLAPEHGLDGQAGAGEEVKDTQDEKTGVTISSLYGKGSGKKISTKILEDIDVLMFDIQDSGMRHYTYISTLMYCMRAAAEWDKEVVVLDRPNPLGIPMEGPLVDPGLKSFISIAPIPIRHGMTVGELAWYFNEYELEKQVKLHVVKMQNYDRRMGLNNNFSAPLSPGLRSLQACYGYSFLGMLGETYPVGIGLRTPLPFQCITLPKRVAFSDTKWFQLKTQLKKYGIDSVLHEYISAKNNEPFRGLHIHIMDINKVPAFTTLLAVLNFFKTEGITISFTKEFDIAMGTRKFREVMENTSNRSELADHVNQQLKEFFQKATHSFMYYPLPQPILIK